MNRDQQADTIYQLLQTQAQQKPEAAAILAPERRSLTYGRLYQHVHQVVSQLNDLGIGRQDRVALVLPNGPEMATAFLAIAACATSAPLNPAYRAAEFDFYLTDLAAKALVVLAGMDSPALEVAQARHIPIIQLTPLAEAAGLFSLSGDQAPSSALLGPSQPDDIALVLHTSGTTSRPKLVPLTQRNLRSSATNIRQTLQLTPQDRCLNVMPLFHIHGLMAAVLASLAAGASMVCTSGFDASHFFDWLAAYQPTWYTAAPTIHQAILARTDRHQDIIAQTPLRFIRSSSSPLPPQVMQILEQTFNAPVIESYGMTEAALQIASNPLPPGRRKPGSVGVAAGPEVALMDETGNQQTPGQTGEIVIRGVNVTLGYENNPQANHSTFRHGWFRTGDQGYMDAEQYLYITGRIKELINRGGEKVAPREVDEALLGHPAVAQAVAFAVPHPTLGEDVGAAVVLREKAAATEKELREFVFGRLADYKVPSRIIIVHEIPKGPTGKLQRIGLAKKLASALKAQFVAPRNSMEEVLNGLWSEVLGFERIGIHDNFFAVGGDSLRAIRLVARVRATFGVDLPLTTIFREPTIAEQALRIEDIVENGATSTGSLVAIQPNGSEAPFFCIPANLGNVFTDLGYLVRHLGLDQPFYGFQDGLHNPSQIGTLAACYIDEMRTIQPEGPYFLGGICFGGAVAFEMAQQLHAQGQRVALLAMVEPLRPHKAGIRRYFNFGRYLLHQVVKRFSYQSKQIALFSTRETTYIRLKIKDLANRWALFHYVPQPYPGRIQLFLTTESLKSPHNPQLGWQKLAIKGAEVHEIPGNHNAITGTHTKIEEAHMRVLAEKLRACLNEAERMIDTR